MSPRLTRSENAARQYNERRLAENFAFSKPNINLMKLFTRNIPMVTRIIIQGKPSLQNTRNLSNYLGRTLGYTNRRNVDKIYRLLLELIHLRRVPVNQQRNYGLKIGRILGELYRSRPKGNGRYATVQRAIIMGIIETVLSPRLARIYGSWYST